MVDEVFKVELVEGNTMIIPSGWIHAVVCVPRIVAVSYSLESSTLRLTRSCLEGIFCILIVFQRVSWLFIVGLESLLGNQPEVRVRNIEIATSVPKKFRFPHFAKYVIVFFSRSTLLMVL